MKKHKSYSSRIGTTQDYSVWTACGLGDGGAREVHEFDIAYKDGEVDCKSCLRSMERKERQDRLIRLGR